MNATPAATKKDTWVDRLDTELTALANAQFTTPEFELLFNTPLTVKRAQHVAIQMVFYNVNRREGWAFVQAKAPWDVKRLIWEHEKDELFHDPRGGSDHRALMSKEAIALGVSEADLAKAAPSPLIQATLMAFNNASNALPWLGAMTFAHFLERRNNSRLVRGGGFSARFRDKMVKELKIESKLLISSNVHVEADMDHSDSIWDAIADHVKDEYSYQIALEGAQTCAVLDRAFRVALAHEMLQIDK
jgi:hypothetical protein